LSVLLIEIVAQSAWLIRLWDIKLSLVCSWFLVN